MVACSEMNSHESAVIGYLTVFDLRRRKPKERHPKLHRLAGTLEYKLV